MWIRTTERRPAPTPSSNRKSEGGPRLPCKSHGRTSVLSRSVAQQPQQIFQIRTQWLRPNYLVLSFAPAGSGESVAEVDFDGERRLICNFQVHPDYRGTGIGRRLLSALLRMPVINSAPVILNARPYGDLAGALAQERLERFYASFGFEATGHVGPKGTEMRLSPLRRRLVAYLTAALGA